MFILRSVLVERSLNSGKRAGIAFVALALSCGSNAPRVAVPVATPATAAAAPSSVPPTVEPLPADCEREIVDYVGPQVWTRLEHTLAQDSTGRMFVTDSNVIYAIEQGIPRPVLDVVEAVYKLDGLRTGVEVTELQVGPDDRLYMWDARGGRLLVASGSLQVTVLPERAAGQRHFLPLNGGHVIFGGQSAPVAAPDAVYSELNLGGIARVRLSDGGLVPFITGDAFNPRAISFVALAAHPQGGLVARIHPDQFYRIGPQAQVATLNVRRRFDLLPLPGMVVDRHGDIYLVSERSVLVARCVAKQPDASLALPPAAASPDQSYALAKEAPVRTSWRPAQVPLPEQAPIAQCQRRLTMFAPIPKNRLDSGERLAVTPGGRVFLIASGGILEARAGSLVPYLTSRDLDSYTTGISTLGEQLVVLTGRHGVVTSTRAHSVTPLLGREEVFTAYDVAALPGHGLLLPGSLRLAQATNGKLGTLYERESEPSAIGAQFSTDGTKYFYFIGYGSDIHRGRLDGGGVGLIENPNHERSPHLVRIWGGCAYPGGGYVFGSGDDMFYGVEDSAPVPLQMSPKPSKFKSLPMLQPMGVAANGTIYILATNAIYAASCVP